MHPRLTKRIKIYNARIEQLLEQWLPPASISPNKLHEAMRYSTMANGKRIRPALVYATAETLNIPLELVDGPAVAIELVHAYSLIHDDLPAMDDDALRRGRATCHKQFDEATAILAGDAIQALSFYILSHDKTMTKDPSKRLKMIETLSLFSGSRGMAGGQAFDLASVGKTLNIVELENMHIHKTAALIRTCIHIAAYSGDSIKAETFNSLDKYAKAVGLSFQVQDDILDVIADTATLGKPQGSDIAQNKPTFPSIIGLKESQEKALELHQQALNSLQKFGDEADVLRDISSWFVTREY